MNHYVDIVNKNLSYFYYNIMWNNKYILILKEIFMDIAFLKNEVVLNMLYI